MKNIVVLLMVSVMTLSLCSCWGGNSDSNVPTATGVEDVSVETTDDTEKEQEEDNFEKE